MYNGSDDEEEFSGEGGWIPWYCSLKGNDFLAEVEEEYIRDNFNLYGLRARFQYYDHALEMILSGDPPEEEDLADKEYLDIYREAQDLYGSIHARYIVSPHGLQVMREKFIKGTFGLCPRYLCDRQHVLPIALTDELRASKVKVFCPKCEQVYAPKNRCKDLDGGYVGVSFPQVFLQSYRSLLPLDEAKPFVPRVFGFKLHKAKSLIARKLEEEESDAEPVNAPVVRDTGAGPVVRRSS
jgi:casein kinase II subunit beta